ncbi:hypothetical protein IM697_18420 [Streptomyces ferrugineus]|uniref:Uncharacterized protein n=1 Tax=Streptomyces ferrugineus TaxID=1413221 RepID=A0A7M2SV23_9ACTN|nr:hypothetical protein [Streptomyces ferrugineus]QOV40197.1 hypothetical protein IM697_18420 [Streptomyces ferrugineus]
MDVAQTEVLTVPLTAAEQNQVQIAAAAAGKTVDGFLRDAVLTAAYDPFLAALEQAADTIAGHADRIQHNHATN